MARVGIDGFVSGTDTGATSYTVPAQKQAIVDVWGDQANAGTLYAGAVAAAYTASAYWIGRYWLNAGQVISKSGATGRCYFNGVLFDAN